MSAIIDVLYDHTLGADAASIDTGAGAIPSGYAAIMVMGTLRSDQSGQDLGVKLTFNGDTAAHYDAQLDYGHISTPVAGGGNAQNYITADAQGTNASDSYPAAWTLWVPAYADTTFWKSGVYQFAAPYAPSNSQYSGTQSVGWRSTAAINQVTVTTVTGNLKAGSRLIVLGVGKVTSDKKISDLTDGGGLAAGDKLVVARSGASDRVSPIGVPVLVYRYTVTGSDKASIDTGVDTPDAGSNDWTNGDLLEILVVARTDEAAARVVPIITFNNDSGNNYDTQYNAAVNASVSGSASVAQAGIGPGGGLHGNGGSASYPGVWRISIPGYANTTFFKVGESVSTVADATAGNNCVAAEGFGWRNTAAITRLKLAAAGSAKLKVGSQLLIYKRLDS